MGAMWREMREMREVMVGLGLRGCGNIGLGNTVWRVVLLDATRQWFALIVDIGGKVKGELHACMGEAFFIPALGVGVSVLETCSSFCILPPVHLFCFFSLC